MLVNINTLPIMLSIGGKERFGAFTGYYYTATFSAAVICPSVIGYLIGATGTYHMDIAREAALEAVRAVFSQGFAPEYGRDQANLENTNTSHDEMDVRTSKGV